MKSPPDPNLTPHPPQGVMRLRELRVWMLRNGVTWVDMGKYMTGVQRRRVTGNAVQKALGQSRMPVANHKALLKAYPHLPPELLPEPLDVPTGPKPRKPGHAG